MNRAVFVLAVVSSLSFVSCGGYSRPYKKPPSGLTNRVLVSQDVSSSFTLAGLVIIDAQKDLRARASEINAGNTPGLMALSPTKATLLAFDSSNNTVQVVDTRTESNVGRIQLLGPTTSMVIPLGATGYAAVPAASINLLPTPGAVQVMNLTSGSTITIGVPNAQTVVSNSNGTQLLVFSNDSNSVSILSPLLAVGPVDQGCDSPQASPVCTVVPGFDHPVYGIFNGSTAYILNCGQECTGTGSGGKAASVQVLHLSTPPTVDPPVPVDGATIGFLSGSSLYVAGNSPIDSACTGQTTAATTCGRLSVIDVGSMTVTNSGVVITDGYHERMDMSLNGQLFIGSHNCTNVGNINNPQGEVRGCLSIFDTAQSGNSTAVIPSDNGDVTGLQSFSTRKVEYVIEGGNVRIYDTTKNTLQKTQVKIVGQVIDVKAVDFF